MVTGAQTCVEVTIPRSPRQVLPQVLTCKQRAALVLDRAGFSHAEIAQRLGLRHRESATRLIGRARARDEAIKKAAREMLGEL